MILTDAGVLYALVNKDEGDANTQCRMLLRRSGNALLLTTWACFAEAMYLAGQTGGWRLQSLLWELVLDATVQFHHPGKQEQERMVVLMGKYRDTPMDLADATLVAAAEALELTRVFTLDSDFRVYRINGQTPFEVIS